jgi:hypothetical protein
MDRVLIASVLGVALAACGPSATRGPSSRTVMTSSSDDVVCTDEESPSGMIRRVCRPPVPASEEAGEASVHCTGDVQTDTHIAKRVCRPSGEHDHDKHFAQAADLGPAVRLRVETGGADLHPKTRLSR